MKKTETIDKEWCYRPQEEGWQNQNPDEEEIWSRSWLCLNSALLFGKRKKTDWWKILHFYWWTSFAWMITSFFAVGAFITTQTLCGKTQNVQTVLGFLLIFVPLEYWFYSFSSRSVHYYNINLYLCNYYRTQSSNEESPLHAKTQNALEVNKL